MHLFSIFQSDPDDFRSAFTSARKPPAHESIDWDPPIAPPVVPQQEQYIMNAPAQGQGHTPRSSRSQNGDTRHSTPRSSRDPVTPRSSYHSARSQQDSPRSSRSNQNEGAVSPKSAVGLGALELNSARSPRLSARSTEKTARSDGTSLADLQVITPV